MSDKCIWKQQHTGITKQVVEMHTNFLMMVQRKMTTYFVRIVEKKLKLTVIKMNEEILYVCFTVLIGVPIVLWFYRILFWYLGREDNLIFRFLDWWLE